jgi:hypothetical protein
VLCLQPVWPLLLLLLLVVVVVRLGLLHAFAARLLLHSAWGSCFHLQQPHLQQRQA